MPCTVNNPALRSSALNSFISRLLCRVHAADSNEHHAVLSVASAINKAATGSTHFFFSFGSSLDPVGRSDCVFTRSGSAPFIGALQNTFAHNDKEECCGESEHQNACESLDWAKHPPLFRQDEIAVPDGGVGNRRKIERRLDVEQTFRQPEEQGPDGDLKQVKDNQQPSDTNEQPCNRPEPCIS